MHKNLAQYTLFILFLCVSVYSEALPPPGNITVKYSEKCLEITWDSVPGVSGYNIYTAQQPGLPLEKKRKINQKMITSGCHFAYIWNVEDSVREKAVKGYKHYISLTSVYKKEDKLKESPQSAEIDNLYFKGYSRAVTEKRISDILLDGRDGSGLDLRMRENSKKDITGFMVKTGRALRDSINSRIDFLETGGCSPISTIAVKIMMEKGIYAYKVNGKFIDEFHSFNVIRIENVDYVIDFAARQFIPDVNPVLIPRKMCHINSRGRADTAGAKIYLISEIYKPEDVELTDSEESEVYKNIYKGILTVPAEKEGD